MSDYELNIVSQHPEFVGKTLRKYNVEGIDTVGAYGSEEFYIVFKNNTYNKVQVKLSLDGVDILTGEPATTDITRQMWVVDGHRSLTLKAYPESMNGGSAFVFTNAQNSVALHKTGSVDHAGIIAAAVYTENRQYHYDFSGIQMNNRSWGSPLRSKTIGGSSYTLQSNSTLKGSDTTTTVASFNNAGQNELSEGPATMDFASQASVGAGQFTQQNIQYVQGLVEPKFNQIVRLKYMWWDELKNKLQYHYGKVAQHPSGFPKGEQHQFINLDGVPKVERLGAQPPSMPVFHRV